MFCFLPSCAVIWKGYLVGKGVLNEPTSLELPLPHQGQLYVARTFPTGSLTDRLNVYVSRTPEYKNSENSLTVKETASCIVLFAAQEGKPIPLTNRFRSEKGRFEAIPVQRGTPCELIVMVKEGTPLNIAADYTLRIHRASTEEPLPMLRLLFCSWLGLVVAGTILYKRRTAPREKNACYLLAESKRVYPRFRIGAKQGAG